MKVLAFANQSGGSVKTTSTVTLAVLAALRGSRVLLIDLDPQRDACHLLGYSDPDELCGRCGERFKVDERGRQVGDCPQGGRHDPQVTMFDVLCGDGFRLEEAVVPALADGAPIDGLDLALASKDLSAVDTNLAVKIGAEQVLDRALSDVDGRYDVVMVDCPPSLGKSMVAIMYASTHVMACVKPGIKEIRALLELERTISTVNSALHRGEQRLRLGGVLIGDVPAESQGLAFQQAVQLVQAEYGELAMPTVARSVRVAEAFANGRAMPFHDPARYDADGRVVSGRVVADYSAVLERMIAAGLLG